MRDHVNSDASRAKRDGPSKDIDPGDSHSGEGVASVSRRLHRTLTDWAWGNKDRCVEPTPGRTPCEPPPELDPPDSRH